MQNCRHRKLSAFSGVVAGGKATLKLPVGEIYEQIILKTNLTVATDIERIEITLNDDKIYNVKATDLIEYRKYEGLTNENGVLVIPFSDMSLKSRNSSVASALVTEMGDHITLDVTLSGAIKTPIQIDTFAVLSDVTEPRVFVPRLYTQTMTATANGDNDFSGVLSSPYRYVRRVFFKTEFMDKLEIHRDARVEGEYHKSVVNMLAKDNGKTPPTSAFAYDSTVWGYMLGSVLPTFHESEFYFRVHTTKVVQSIDMVMQVLERVR